MQQTTKARVKLRSLISEEIYMTGAFHSLPSGELLVSGVYGERRKVYARRKLTDILLYKGCDGSIFPEVGR
jgi:hypothetical protein